MTLSFYQREMIISYQSIYGYFLSVLLSDYLSSELIHTVSLSFCLPFIKNSLILLRLTLVLL